jgi:hypothetical protein
MARLAVVCCHTATWRVLTSGDSRADRTWSMSEAIPPRFQPSIAKKSVDPEMMSRSGRECPADSPSAVYWQEHQLQDFLDAVAKGRAIFVVGTGLSISGSARPSTASWIGLLEESLDYISDRKMANEEWRPMIDHTLAYARSTSDTTALVSVAGMVQSQIKLAGDFAYAKWLKETVGELKPVDESWAKALDAVSCPILTTNYDSLVEQSTGRQSATGEAQGRFNGFSPITQTA